MQAAAGWAWTHSGSWPVPSPPPWAPGPTALQWAEKLLTDWDQGGEGRPEGVGGREEEVHVVWVGGHRGQEGPCGEATSSE